MAADRRWRWMKRAFVTLPVWRRGTSYSKRRHLPSANIAADMQITRIRQRKETQANSTPTGKTRVHYSRQTKCATHHAHACSRQQKPTKFNSKKLVTFHPTLQKDFCAFAPKFGSGAEIVHIIVTNYGLLVFLPWKTISDMVVCFWAMGVGEQ